MKMMITMTMRMMKTTTVRTRTSLRAMRWYDSGNVDRGSALSYTQDAMTEEQRMEEGRRMFQIFAARMFEQRVLTAYREKVAAERQQKLLEELDEESRLDTQREA